MAFTSRPFSAQPFSARRLPIASGGGGGGIVIVDTTTEAGFAAWTFSRAAKLNAWAWHGLGTTESAKINSWASLGKSVYLRRDGDTYLYVFRPDVFLASTDTNNESLSVHAQTQWMDFGKPGMRKSLYGMDFDGLNVTAVEVYVSENGGRSGTLADTILVNSNQSGWTYSGELLPVDADGTEFMLRMIGDPNLEVQINRFTLYWESLGDN